MGGADASFTGMIVASVLAILGCGILGLFSGSMVAYFGVPSFVVTLGMMMVASGFAYMISGGLSIYQIPSSFDWLGRGDAFFGIPNAVVLMVILYIFAHFVMSRTTAGRYIYAVGGNPEAARLSGVPVKRILLWVYTVSGALAGLGGVVMASQFRSGDPKYGLMYELYVIAAVVVGGTSWPVGGESVWNPNWCFHNRSDSKWNEFDRRTELYPESCPWSCTFSCGFTRYAEETRLEAKLLARGSVQSLKPGLHDEIKFTANPGIGGCIIYLRRRGGVFASSRVGQI